MECPHIPELSYGEFGKRLREKVADQRIPLAGSLELTFRCNLRCVHCYVAHGHQGIPGKEAVSKTVADISKVVARLSWRLVMIGRA